MSGSGDPALCFESSNGGATPQGMGSGIFVRRGCRWGWELKSSMGVLQVQRCEDWEVTTPGRLRQTVGGVDEGCHQKWSKVMEGLTLRRCTEVLKSF